MRCPQCGEAISDKAFTFDGKPNERRNRSNHHCPGIFRDDRDKDVGTRLTDGFGLIHGDEDKTREDG